MKNSTLGISLILVACSLLACSKHAGGSDVDANVACKGSKETIDCNVTHKAGSVGANVCWAMKFTCQNGTIASSDEVCQAVQPGGTSQKRIPISQLKNFDKCDKAVSTEIVNQRLAPL